MKFWYSIIRFVPDVARGEFVNVGLCLVEDGSRPDEEFGWIGYHQGIVKSNWSRALSFSGWKSLDTVVDLFNDFSFPKTYDELIKESKRSGIIQYSSPLPCTSESGDEMFGRLWNRLVKDLGEEGRH